MAGANNLTVSRARTDPITHNPATALTTSLGNQAQLRQTGSARHEMYEDDGGAGGTTKVILDPLGVTAIIGRGDTDTNITYLALFNTNGILVYNYPNGAGTGWISTTVKP